MSMLNRSCVEYHILASERASLTAFRAKSIQLLLAMRNMQRQWNHNFHPPSGLEEGEEVAEDPEVGANLTRLLEPFASTLKVRVYSFNRAFLIIESGVGIDGEAAPTGVLSRLLLVDTMAFVPHMLIVRITGMCGNRIRAHGFERLCKACHMITSYCR